MRNLIAAVVAMLWTTLASLPTFAQAAPPSEASRQAELSAAWQAGTKGPADISLIEQAVLKLPAGFFFVPKAEAMRALRALGNVIDDASFVGLVVGTRQSDEWIVVIRYIKDGYIKEDDAKNWNADDLLKNISEGVEEANKDRAARGFPGMQVSDGSSRQPTMQRPTVWSGPCWARTRASRTMRRRMSITIPTRLDVTAISA